MTVYVIPMIYERGPCIISINKKYIFCFSSFVYTSLVKKVSSFSLSDLKQPNFFFSCLNTLNIPFHSLYN